MWGKAKLSPFSILISVASVDVSNRDLSFLVCSSKLPTGPHNFAELIWFFVLGYLLGNEEEFCLGQCHLANFYFEL